MRAKKATATSAGAEPFQFSPQQAETVVRLIETAPSVSRRHQFFVWSQSSLHNLLPHQVLVCGAYARQQRALLLSVFQSVVITPLTLEPLTDPTSALMKSCASEWVAGGGRPLTLRMDLLAGKAQEQARRLQSELGHLQLVVHGVARPQRLSELECLFVFLCQVEPSASDDLSRQSARHADCLMPYLHATWRRVLAADFEWGNEQTALKEPSNSHRRTPSADPQQLTERELEILIGAREGKSNPQIGRDLHISALTVKNHIQKILRKLGARNRAHAVALAMTQGLFAPSP